jgi:hypothetical protein
VTEEVEMKQATVYDLTPEQFAELQAWAKARGVGFYESWELTK